MQYPDWVMEAKKSRELLSWIQDPVHSFKMFHGRLLLKCQEEDCIVFYAVDSKEKDCLQLKEPKLCGVLYLPDYFSSSLIIAFAKFSSCTARLARNSLPIALPRLSLSERKYNGTS